MCGIVGYIGYREASKVIHECLKNLEYRGYDSWGIATISNKNEINLIKEVGMIGDIKEVKLLGSLGIGHTRWATHGGVEKKNAHPHLDCKKSIALVHNGIISNFEELRKKLEKNHAFTSDTDTECIVHLIEEIKDNDSSLENAVRKALSKVKGTYALAIISNKEPDKIICARNESPLILGIGKNEMFIGSDIASFLKFTKKALPLDDGEYAIVTSNGYVVKEIATGKEVKKEPIIVEWSLEVAEKQGYPHFMLKEIYEEPQAITQALNVYPEDIKKLAEMIKNANTVYLTGAGTSLHACMIAEYWFAKLCNKLVIAIDSSELIEKGVVDEKTLVVGVTQSGETYDTLLAMRQAKRKGAKVASIVNVIGSTATRIAEHVILQASGIEIAVCATKTFVSQLVILLRVAIELAKMQGNKTEEIEKELYLLPEYIKEVLKLDSEIKKVAKELKVKNYLFIGRGINFPSALEGALKFKEITYLHAEGMSAGLLKHGTISLIDKDMHTIALIPAEGKNRTRIKSNIQEVKARKGEVLAFTMGMPLENCDFNITLPKCNELLSPLIFAPAYQLLAYHKAVELGRNVDKPRALAKSVTVE